jgi:hypothetical protein
MGVLFAAVPVVTSCTPINGSPQVIEACNLPGKKRERMTVYPNVVAGSVTGGTPECCKACAGIQ